MNVSIHAGETKSTCSGLRRLCRLCWTWVCSLSRVGRVVEWKVRVLVAAAEQLVTATRQTDALTTSSIVKHTNTVSLSSDHTTAASNAPFNDTVDYRAYLLMTSPHVTLLRQSKRRIYIDWFRDLMQLASLYAYLMPKHMTQFPCSDHKSVDNPIHENVVKSSRIGKKFKHHLHPLSISYMLSNI